MVPFINYEPKHRVFLCFFIFSKHTMKKLFLLFCILAFPVQSFATLDEKSQRMVDFYTQRASNIVEVKGAKYKELILITLGEKLDTSTSWTKRYEVFKELIIQVSAIWLDNAAKEYYENEKINIQSLKTTWLNWQNEVRKKLLLPAFSYNSKLDITAFEWSYISRSKTTMDHKRSPGDSYYDYDKITTWFSNRWVTCRNVNGATYSESIGWWNFYCTDGDCTNEMQDVMKDIFDMYMAEKWKRYPADAHYRAIVHNSFKYIWLWLATKKSTEKANYYTLYVTTHYCTDLIQ